MIRKLQTKVERKAARYRQCRVFGRDRLSALWQAIIAPGPL